MPVFFYIDPEFAEDPRMVNVDLITLSYTFFEAKEGHTLPLPGYNWSQQLSPASDLWFLKNHVSCLLRRETFYNNIFRDTFYAILNVVIFFLQFALLKIENKFIFLS